MSDVEVISNMHKDIILALLETVHAREATSAIRTELEAQKKICDMNMSRWEYERSMLKKTINDLKATNAALSVMNQRLECEIAARILKRTASRRK